MAAKKQTNPTTLDELKKELDKLTENPALERNKSLCRVPGRGGSTHYPQSRIDKLDQEFKEEVGAILRRVNEIALAAHDALPQGKSIFLKATSVVLANSSFSDMPEGLVGKLTSLRRKITNAHLR